MISSETQVLYILGWGYARYARLGEVGVEVTENGCAVREATEHDALNDRGFGSFVVGSDVAIGVVQSGVLKP